jgi:carbamoylphosphate synthase large subunit
VNVLLTSVGSNMAIVRSFARAAAARGGKVYVADRDDLAPTVTIANGRVGLPPAGDRDFLAALVDSVDAHDIAVIVPMADAELPVLAAEADAFAERGCHVAVSLPELVALVDDKLATVDFCHEHQIRTPATWSPDALAGAELPEHLFVRPNRASGSGEGRRVHRDRLVDEVTDLDECIVQEDIRRAEVTIDTLFAGDGTLIHFVPRLRLVVEAGRSVRSVTIGRHDINAWASRVLELLGHHGARGLVSVQAFVGRGEPLLIEVNARAANGLPLTIAAGGDQAEWLLQLVEGRRPNVSVDEYERGLYMSTAFEPVFSSNPR